MKRWLFYPFLLLFGLFCVALAGLGAAVCLAWPRLPSLETLTDYRPKIPLRVYSSDGYLLREFGEEKRALITLDQVPKVLIQAILATEDARFYQHKGVDPIGILRAAVANVASGEHSQGASTITMQVARNFFLTREKFYSRKFYEALLALKIEQNLNKNQILEIYLNQIFMGHRAYGFAAAAKTYFGKKINEINLQESAILAGIPKGPSIYNPFSNPKLTKKRLHTVLLRMENEGFIDAKTRTETLALPIQTRNKKDFLEADSVLQKNNTLRGDYVAEMARQIAVEQFGEDAYALGLRIITTINMPDQRAANRAVRANILQFDRRYGYRGPEGFVDISGLHNDPEALNHLLAAWPDYEDLPAALVLSATPNEVKVFRHGGVISIKEEGLKLVAKALKKNASQKIRLRTGSVVRIHALKDQQWEILQLPEIQAALVSIDSNTGAVRALAAGFDFSLNKFNNVTQAWRQPGSSFKPFIYSAALENGFSPASYIDDSPLTFSSKVTGSKSWSPRNYDGRFDGPMTMRTALMRSRNIPTIRLLEAVTPLEAQKYITRFGFSAKNHPAYLTMALGAGSVTPWQMAGAYAVFANGGYKIDPYIVREITDSTGNVLARSRPLTAHKDAPRVIDPRNAWLMNSMLRDVVAAGTGARAQKALKRNDLAGKTGTTNDFVDTWFTGYTPETVAISWVGYSQPRSMGRGATGSSMALPVWIDYMRSALQNTTQTPLAAPPPGLASVFNEERNMMDYYYQENPPPEPPMPEPTDFFEWLKNMPSQNPRQPQRPQADPTLPPWLFQNSIN